MMRNYSKSIFLLHLAVYLHCILQVTCQHQRIASGPNPLWRQRVQWQNNGRVYSLLSQGAEYQPSRRSSASSASHNPLLLLSSRNNTSPGSSGRPQPSRSENVQGEVRHTTASSQASDSASRLWFQANRRSQGEDAAGRHRSRPESTTERRQTTPQLSSAQQTQRINATTSNTARLDMMQGDDPYNPYKYNEDNPYYNYYDTYERPRQSDRQRPGYGTRYHQYGKKKQRLFQIYHFSIKMLARYFNTTLSKKQQSPMQICMPFRG